MNKIGLTQEEIDSYNKQQQDGRYHPLTCCSGDKNTPNCMRRARTSEGILIATKFEWICPCGEYKQKYHGR